MNGGICMDQMSIFDFIQVNPKEIFNPIADYAMHGSGFTNGKKRIAQFFSENTKQSERIAFLKKEYGVGGWGFWSDKPCVVHQAMSDASCHKIEYNDENGQSVEIKITYAELEQEIDNLIKSGKYIAAESEE